MKTYLQAIIACIIWGFSFVWTEVGLKSFHPVTLVLMRLVIGTVFLYIVAKSMKKIHPVHPKDWKWFLLLASLEPYLYFMGETYAQTMVSSTLTSVVISTIPLFAPFSAYFILKEKVSILNILGIIVSLAGVFCIVFTDGSDLSANLLGIILLAVAVFSAVFYAVVLKKLSHRYNSFNIVFYQNLIGMIYFIPTFLILDLRHLGEKPILFDSVFSIVMLAIFASVIAFILFSNAVRVFGVARSNVFCNIMPAFTAVFAWIVLGDQLTGTKIIGIIIVIIGLFVSQLSVKKVKIHHERSEFSSEASQVRKDLHKK